MMVKQVNSSTAFEKDIEKLNRRYKDMEKLKSIVRSLVNGEKLDQIYRDHKLTGNYYSYRECHIESNWLLIYKLDNEVLFLIRTGTHNDLFR
jgi:mRNA interferase YafQ